MRKNKKTLQKNRSEGYTSFESNLDQDSSL